MAAIVSGHLNIYEQDKFRAQLSRAWKKFCILGTRLENLDSKAIFMLNSAWNFNEMLIKSTEK